MANANANKEAALYCAALTAQIRQAPSSWTYIGDEGVEYEITALPNGVVSRPVRFE